MRPPSRSEWSGTPIKISNVLRRQKITGRQTYESAPGSHSCTPCESLKAIEVMPQLVFEIVLGKNLCLQPLHALERRGKRGSKRVAQHDVGSQRVERLRESRRAGAVRRCVSRSAALSVDGSTVMDRAASVHVRRRPGRRQSTPRAPGTDLRYGRTPSVRHLPIRTHWC